MEFVNPGFLYGLVAIAIPVIIHLFNFRRFRKVYFTNVEFIRELKQETRKQSNLKHLLVLVARMLAVAAIVLAFARPYIPLEDTGIRALEQNSISVYVDNSFSMQAESPDGSLLQTALGKAREIASIYKGSDRFQLLTNDFEGRHQRFVSKEEFLDLLNEVDFSPVVRSFGAVRIRQEEMLRREQAAVRSSYMISDFQALFMNGAAAATDSLIPTYLVPVSAVVTDNLYIDSCWFESPVQQADQLVNLNLSVRNSSESGFEDIPVKLRINGQQRALASFGIGPGDAVTVKLTYSIQSTGIQAGELEINDYPVNFDDRFYFSYRVNETVNVLAINEAAPDFYLNSLFGDDTLVRFVNSPSGQLDFSSLADYDLIILNSIPAISSGLSQELDRFMSAGGSVLIFPPSVFADASYASFLRVHAGAAYGGLDTTRQRVGTVNLGHPLFTGVFESVPENIDLPLVQDHFRLNTTGPAGLEALLELQNGDPFLTVTRRGRGALYLSAVPLLARFSNFQQHPMFVPVLYKIAIASVSGEQLYYTLGLDEVIRVESVRQSSEEVLRIVNADRSFEAIPEHRRIGHLDELNVYGQVREAGNYLLIYSGEPVAGLAFNYDRSESEMIFHTPEELRSIVADRQLSAVQVLESAGRPLAQSLAEMSRGVQLWKWFVLAALAFLLVETLLLRFLA